MFDYQKVKLIAITKPVSDDFVQNSTAENLISYCARVSNPSNQTNFDSAPKLLKYCMTHDHWSIFEMAHAVLEIQTTRDIGRQILRHRSFSFQEFCVEENTKVRMKKKSVPIKDLYKRQCNKQYSDMSDWLVKIYDKESKKLTYAKIKEVFETGIKPVYEVELDNGKKIVCTKEHKLLTYDGYMCVENLSEDNFVACNGVPVYQNKQWLLDAKKTAIENGGGIQMIADFAGVKYVTIKKWLKKHQIKFTREEVATYMKVWNKGLPKEQQPMYGKFHSLSTREKQRNSSRKKENSNLYINGNSCTDTISWRKRVAMWCGGYKTELLISQNYICPITGKTLTKENCELDHILPVCFRPDLAFDKNNLRVIHQDAHAEKTQKELWESKYTITYSKIKSITYVGERQTYDLEVDHIDHNYVANGIITHNSTRYAEVNQSLDFIREARLQDMKNRQNSIELNENDLNHASIASNFFISQQIVWDKAMKFYKQALEDGIAKEQARSLLPEGLTMSRMYMAGSLRSWIHYCTLRMENGTQKEHIDIATKCYEILSNEFPFMKEI